MQGRAARRFSVPRGGRERSRLLEPTRARFGGLLSRDTPRTMSQENVETFKRAADAYNRRDVEALLKELDPEVEYSEIRDQSDRIVGIGRVRMRDRQSGVETESPMVSVTDVKNGKGIRVWNYVDPREAREVAAPQE
jgi:ketosteroid isomerase-like protein